MPDLSYVFYKIRSVMASHLFRSIGFLCQYILKMSEVGEWRQGRFHSGEIGQNNLERPVY